MKPLRNAVANKLIARWITTKYGTKVPIYTQYDRRHDEPKLKEKKTAGNRYTSKTAKKQPDVFNSIKQFEKHLANPNLDNDKIAKVYTDAMKAYDNNKKAISRLHKEYEEDEIKRLKQAEYRLNRIMFQLKQRSRED